jgi:hypothetical protein
MDCRDADAAREFATNVKSKEELKALHNAVDKLRRLGPQLAPPHVKKLKGDDAAGLCELRPRHGRSDWRALYRRVGDVYVILAVCRHAEMDPATLEAQRRVPLYDSQGA